eukprot:3745891-Pyramimonas_sp.AAC.1
MASKEADDQRRHQLELDYTRALQESKAAAKVKRGAESAEASTAWPSWQGEVSDPKYRGRRVSIGPPPHVDLT